MQKFSSLRKEIDNVKLKEAAEIIKNGGIVVFPTETVYGIGTNGLDEKAIKKLYKIKQRSMHNPISLLVNNIDMINKLAKNITKVEYEIIEKCFPGPLTIILKKKDIVPDILTANKDTVGIRMPANETALKLIEYTGIPIATSSANISGKQSGTNLETIIQDFEGKVHYFINGGKSKIGLASTVVQVIDEVPHILRQGAIDKNQIEQKIMH